VDIGLRDRRMITRPVPPLAAEASPVEEQTRRVALYGREDVLGLLTLALGPAPVALLTGDSGVGKSAVLDAAQASDRQRGIVAPSPTRLTFAGGAFSEDCSSSWLPQQVRLSPMPA
jgi:putative protein kinase ArgK-like GTPase of G3E family